ncbi:MAG: bifunctional phosphopantothenoylcysteine decarboxylase/phosphopantothenate--cysteine ligase CoaBC [Gammaproteobacteria bacterium]|nr:bifunctional phosphopantothenoylcysteine decarboxylase/phosphopantothenate--cysteine ligase CoaBC [Gammaproteobacteria bacterium]MDE0285454.1 bifunctional phosphopantothenoylcysteine decarboxylase/phosphopantothenate--cysteine ligase CoaBC [Gammaproteobacteria bacterium]
MQTLTDKRILLGITGGIAAYKSAELVRRLRDHGAEIRVVMTPAASEFITPLTLQALSGNPVHTDLLDHAAEAAMGHIELARWADAVVIAPATANFIARLSNGLADDLLSTLCLATAAPLLVAPAMNRQMWQNPATQENIARLQARGVTLLGPASGAQACGETGPGRLIDPEELVQAIVSAGRTNRLAGVSVLVSAGPTREFIDPVRYISNRSSGRMGYAMAKAAEEAGAAVTLVSGPVSLTPPARVSVIDITSSGQMHSEILDAAATCDIFISSAAVADYRTREAAPNKMKKKDSEPVLRLEKTPDILAEVAALPNAPFTVGFAAETENLHDNAKQKLKSKNLDMIAANRVGDGLGFDVEENALEVFWPGGTQSLGTAPKENLARQLIEIIVTRYREKATEQSHKPAETEVSD